MISVEHEMYVASYVAIPIDSYSRHAAANKTFTQEADMIQEGVRVLIVKMQITINLEKWGKQQLKVIASCLYVTYLLRTILKAKPIIVR